MHNIVNVNRKKYSRKLHFFSSSFCLVFVLIPVIVFAQNYNYDDTDYSMVFKNLQRPLPVSMYVQSLLIWILPIPIALKKENYGKDFGRVYWKWVLVFVLVSAIFWSMGWFYSLLMFGIFLVGFSWRSTDEVIADIVNSVEEDHGLKEVNLHKANSTKEKSEVAVGSRMSSTHDSNFARERSMESQKVPNDKNSLDEFRFNKQGMSFNIGGRLHKFDGSNFIKIDSEENFVDDVSQSQELPVKKIPEQEPQLYKGGMIFMISGHPHQFNGYDFERVDIDEIVVINGKTFIWNGKNFVTDS
jgi:hypothetical protein